MRRLCRQCQWFKYSLIMFLPGFFFLSTYANSAIIPEKIAFCNTCHQGFNSSMPNLAGQSALYLAKQLHDFKAGEGRHSEIMSPIVDHLTDEEIATLAAFYAQLPLPLFPHSSENIKRGQQLYQAGNLNKHIPACIICHGPHGTGDAKAGFPVLSGQQIAYTIQQLYAFKHKKRRNDSAAIMRSICASMDDKDIQAVAVYSAGLH